MNVLQGLNIQGLVLNTQDNFNSIPGLRTWVDSRERVTQSGGLVSLWGDKSAEGNNFGISKDNRKPELVGQWVDFNASAVQGDYLESTRKDYRFLHNGASYGIYAIFKCNILNFVDSSVSIVDTLLSGTGFNVLFAAQQNGRISIQVKNAGTFVRSIDITNIAPTNIGETIVLFRHLYKGAGVTGNHIVQYNNLIDTRTVANTGYGTGQSDSFYIAGNANLGKSFKFGLCMVYDWTGIAPGVIDSYDARITTLLNKEKLLFQQQDI